MGQNLDLDRREVWPQGWQTPDWPAPGHVRAVMTSRYGGVSTPPYDSFNLGDHVGDDTVAVMQNRQQLQSLLGVRPVYLKQVHGVEVAHVGASTANGTQADACVSTDVGTACTIMVADCLPVLFCDREGLVVGAAHAGWRGLAAGVLEATVTAMLEALELKSARNDASPPDASALMAWLGPCIGPEQFEVGNDVRDTFVADLGSEAEAAFQPLPVQGKWLCDLPRLARLRLERCGIKSIWGNDGSAGWCTVTQSLLFFSHRRDAVRLGGSGRLAGCIWLA